MLKIHDDIKYDTVNKNNFYKFVLNYIYSQAFEK